MNTNARAFRFSRRLAGRSNRNLRVNLCVTQTQARNRLKTAAVSARWPAHVVLIGMGFSIPAGDPMTRTRAAESGLDLNHELVHKHYGHFIFLLVVSSTAREMRARVQILMPDCSFFLSIFLSFFLSFFISFFSHWPFIRPFNNRAFIQTNFYTCLFIYLLFICRFKRRFFPFLCTALCQWLV